MQHSIPNDYSLIQSTSNNHQKVTTYTSIEQRPPIATPANSETTLDNGSYAYSFVKDEASDGEYDYAGEEEFWEPASQERELKLQLEKVLEIPVIKGEDLK